MNHPLSPLRSGGLKLMVNDRNVAKLSFIFSYSTSLLCPLETAQLCNIGEATLPRRVNQQIHRSNTPADGPMEFYQRTAFIPFLDFIISELRDRFQSFHKLASGFTPLLPVNVLNKDFSDIRDVVIQFLPILPSDHPDAIKAEFLLWKTRWVTAEENSAKIPQNLMEVLDTCNPVFFPNLNKLLRIFATLPVTTAEGERSFSTLAHIKSYRRSTMTDERLNGLASIYIHQDHISSFEKCKQLVECVLDLFAKSHRRLEF